MDLYRSLPPKCRPARVNARFKCSAQLLLSLIRSMNGAAFDLSTKDPLTYVVVRMLSSLPALKIIHECDCLSQNHKAHYTYAYLSE